MLGSIFHFHSNFNKTFCKQTVKTLIRRRVLRRVVRVCTICLRPTKWTLGLYGLTWNQLIKCKRQMTYINASIEYSHGMWIRATPIQPPPPTLENHKWLYVSSKKFWYGHPSRSDWVCFVSFEVTDQHQPFLNQRRGKNALRNYFNINLNESMGPSGPIASNGFSRGSVRPSLKNVDH